MYGQDEISHAPRLTWVALHLALVGVAAWILLGGGYGAVTGLFGAARTPGDPGRRTVLFLFGAVLWVRMTLTVLVLLKRRFGWSEFGAVLAATVIYQVGFPLLGAGARAPLGWPDGLGIALFLLGSWLNTGSEFQRKRFKDDPAHRGRLYTGGLFRLARHINYFGDFTWAVGWALVTRNAWAGLIPLLMAAGFIFVNIPALSRYLHAHYGAEYDEWARHSKRFIPFVY